MLRKNILNNEKIPLALYKKFVSLMPVCCVDAVLKVGEKVFLFKRAYEPAKNKWWLIGGRILKGERLNDAVIRKIKEEISVDAKIISRVGVYENFFRVSRFGKKEKRGTHNISICFLVKPKKKNFKLNLNEEYTDYRTITKIDKNLHPYVQTVLRDCGVR